jgi:hypothetical protein
MVVVIAFEQDKIEKTASFWISSSFVMSRLQSGLEIVYVLIG